LHGTKGAPVRVALDPQPDPVQKPLPASGRTSHPPRCRLAVNSYTEDGPVFRCPPLPRWMPQAPNRARY